MATKHTPGPWHARYNGHYWDIQVEPGAHEPKFAYSMRNPHDPRTAGLERERANAHLIAAAPQLLEALAEHVEYADDGKEHDPHCVCLLCRSRAAIALATTGEEG